MIRRAGRFDRFADAIIEECGRARTFAWNLLLFAGWLAMGPVTHWSDSWQLVCASYSAVVTTLQGFLVINRLVRVERAGAQDTAAIKAAIAGLVRADPRVPNELAPVDEQ